MFDFRLWLSAWFKKKYILNEQVNLVFFGERQVWMAHLGVNIGHEQNGGKNFLRPVLILKKWSSSTALIIPLTTKSKDIPSRVSIKVITKNSKPSFLLLDQLKTIDAKRLSHKIGIISVEDFLLLKQKIVDIL